jgi:hypothetical protein
MKKFILLLFAAFAIGWAYSQPEATLRIADRPDVITPGDTVNVSIYCDAITGGPVRSGQFFILYNPEVLTPLLVPNPYGGDPQYWTNLNLYFLFGGAIPASSNPSPGDLRFVFVSFTQVGMTAGSTLFQMAFTYNGGYTDITFDFVPAKLVPTIPDLPGGKLEKGETKMANTSNVNFILEPFAVSGSVGVSGPTANIWQGDAIAPADPTDWFTGENWSLGTVPPSVEPYDDVEIPMLAKASYPTIAGGIAYTGTLTLATGATLLVGPTGGLETHGLFTNDGFFGVVSDGAGNGGTYIDFAGVGGNGLYNYWRDMGPTYPEGDVRGWHFISAPISPFFTSDIYDYWLNVYDEGLASYFHIEGDEPNCIPYNDGQYPPAPTTQPLQVGPLNDWQPSVGWSVKFDEAYDCEAINPGTGTVIEFGGGPLGPPNAAGVHTGPIPAPFLAAGADPAHWNLLGNPYYSAINAELMTWPVELNVETHKWDADGGIGAWIDWSPALPPGDPAAIIAPTQGFFTSAIINGVLGFTNAERVHGGTFYKSEVSSYLKLQASNGELLDYTHIRFMDEATEGFDRVWDAHQMDSDFAIYTYQDGIETSINAQPNVKPIPMAFVASADGQYTIDAVETSDFTEIYLQDLLTGEVTDLLASGYSFTHVTGNDPDRFVIHFAPLGTPEFDINSVNIYSHERNIYVNVPETLMGNIVVFNMMGQEVVSLDTEPGMNVIPMDNVNTYYVVKVVSNNQAITGKVYIK